jgi:hypothetical protein
MLLYYLLQMHEHDDATQQQDQQISQSAHEVSDKDLDHCCYNSFSTPNSTCKICWVVISKT